MVPITIISIENDGFHLMVEGFINGKDARFLIDTGASRTVFDQERILDFFDEAVADFERNEKLSTGLGTSNMESKSVMIMEIRIGELVARDYTAVVLDMTHINESYSKLNLPGIDGVLGGDLLQRFSAVIDYGSKELRFLT